MNRIFTYHLDKENHVLAWKITGRPDLDEVIEIIKIIKSEVKKLPRGKVKLLVDNRKMLDHNGIPLIFSTEVNSEWINLQKWLIYRCSRVIVLCDTLLMMAQMNRIARISGLSCKLKALWNINNEVLIKEAYSFLKIKSNELIK